MDQSSGALESSSPRLQTVAGTRRYRSKAQRPCDVCRSRKVLCNIPDSSKPCQLCERIGRKCTFVGKTTRRQLGKGSSPRALSQLSPNGDANMPSEVPLFPLVSQAHAVEPPVVRDNDDDDEGFPVGASIQMDQGLALEVPAPDFTWPLLNDNGDGWGLLENNLNDRSLAFQESTSAFDFLPDFHQNENVDLGDVFLQASHHEDNGTERIPPAEVAESLSVDQKPGYSATFIGYSNESDPFALEHFPYGQREEVDFFRVTYRQITPNDGSSMNRPLHFLQSQKVTAREAEKVVEDCLPNLDDRSHLETIVDRENGVALVHLYFKFVFPSLPVVSRSQVLHDVPTFVAQAPTGLLAGIYALSLPFAAWDESLCLHNAYTSPSVDALWKITHTCLQRELQFPQLSTVQTFLLLLNFLPFDSASVENPFAWSMAAAMLAMAQSLGLNADPSRWNLPAWEIRLRRRLWWAVVVEHTWRSITHGRSSMLREDDWNVSPLGSDDFTIDIREASRKTDLDVSPDYFLNLCSLSLIADEICRKFFTLRAVSRNKPLDQLVTEARPLRQKLIEWWEDLPDFLQLNFEKAGSPEGEEDSVENHAPLYVAYYTAHVLLFRALLRPIVSKTSTDVDVEFRATASAVLQASRSLIRTIVNFICGFDARQQSAFWPAYTRHCLAYPGLFSYMLALQRVESHMVTHDRNLLAIWRKTLRARVQSWPLLRFALIKIDAIYWKGVQEPTR